MAQSFEDNKNWKFLAEQLEDEWNMYVIPSNDEKREVPNSLFKYYAITDYSLNALENEYLYASDRWQLNDPFDCHKELVDFTNYSIDDLKNILNSDYFLDFIINQRKNNINEKHSHLDSVQKLKEEANLDTNIWNSIVSSYSPMIFEIYHMESFKNFGVVSMTENANNMLMWAHYTGNKGYALEFDSSKFDVAFNGPFQVAYRELLEPCCNKQYGATSFLYQSMIKSKVWDYENEWRLLAYSKDGINIAGLNQSILAERKFSAPKPLSITLASAFFSFNDFKKINGKQFEVTLSGNQLRVINHALHSNTSIFWIVPPDLLHRGNTRNLYNTNLNEFKLTRVPINIKRKVANTFHINIVEL